MAKTAVRVSVLLAVGILLVAPRARAEETYRVALEGGTPIEAVLVAVVKSVGAPLVWDPKSRALQGKEIAGDVVLAGTHEEVIAALRSLLTFYELVLVPVGEGANLRILVLDSRATTAIVKMKPVWIEITAENVAEYEGQDGLFVATVIGAGNLRNLRDVRNSLNRIVTGQNIGNVTEVPEANAFVVTDFAPNVAAIWRMVRALDAGPSADGTDGREVVFRALPLTHASAAEVAAGLSTLLQTGRPGPATRSGQTDDESPGWLPADPALRLWPDARLNQILLLGTAHDVEVAATAAAALDQPTTSTAPAVELIRLEHGNAAEVAAILDRMVNRNRDAWGGDDAPVVEAAPGSNAVLIQAGASAAEVLRRLVAEMDR